VRQLQALLDYESQSPEKLMQLEIRWFGDAIAAPTCHQRRDSKILESISSETLRTDHASWYRWMGMITPMLVRLWSRVSRKREFARIRAAWETIDDRMLRDVGVSRYEIEYADLNVTGVDLIPVRASARTNPPEPSICWQL
jgi:uncharacterized protein YjiS (DUF1127 family)